jgi:intergrase/recombinase
MGILLIKVGCENATEEIHRKNKNWDTHLKLMALFTGLRFNEMKSFLIQTNLSL